MTTFVTAIAKVSSSDEQPARDPTAMFHVRYPYLVFYECLKARSWYHIVTVDAAGRSA